jgi:hypothetical protein
MEHSLKLTPSEVELLRTNNGPDSILFGHLTRKLTDESCSMLPVLERLFMKALEANQAVGNFIFQIQEGRPKFGVRSKKRLFVRVNGSQYTWPAPSLEASLNSLVRSLSTDEGMLPVSDLLKAWFAERAITHFQSGVRWVYEALADRGWVQKREEQRLNLFSLTSYEIPAITKGLLEGSMSQTTTAAPGDNPEWLQSAHLIISHELEKELRRLNSRA